jgi:hypothetical protein
MSELPDYAKGVLACQKGEECPEGASSDFERGYGNQKQLDEIISHNTEALYGSAN